VVARDAESPIVGNGEVVAADCVARVAALPVERERSAHVLCDAFSGLVLKAEVGAAVFSGKLAGSR
jgi:hypothetical protein